ncbi:hypothetical protein OS493_007379 [Desmophyllum pertusum]|uniref:Uncharacterized protein n=1 Tax=Desmophyllum pertusum TaxID=174260 RepID=A0A9X0CUW0_9CNID|nr:hypothetical protein OS493_007379 [Desmophyllum pertusum]
MAENTGGRSDKKGSFFPSSRCHCAARESVHVHCPCDECKGKAVNPKTQQKHLLSFNQREVIEHEIESSTDQDGGDSFEVRSEVEEDTQAMNSECMNLEDDEGRNYYSNQPSTSNQLFNTDISGGSCYVSNQATQSLLHQLHHVCLLILKIVLREEELIKTSIESS